MGRDRGVDESSAAYRAGGATSFAGGIFLPGPGKLKALPGLKAAKLDHIFRAARGHVNPSTVASRNRFLNLFERVVSDPNNLRGAARGPGVTFYTKTFRNGKQVWVEVRGGRISNGGVNLPGAHR